MKSLTDPASALTSGLDEIRAQFKIPEHFPPEVLAAAEAAAKRAPDDHVDRTDIPFVTLDPASSTDLDQAFWIEPSGPDLVLRYAIADVAWFVRDGDALDIEAWERGETFYLPDGRAGLYPPSLSEDAASLLPDVTRPAVVFAVRVAPDGGVKLDGAERALIRSRAKLAYDSVTDAQLPDGFAELWRRIDAAEARRGASRVDPPEQQVSRLVNGDYELAFRPLLQSEEQNSALSLAANLAIADALLAHRTGLFRVMAPADGQDEKRLRNSAKAFGLNWPAQMSLRDFQRSLDPQEPHQAALMLEIRRAGKGASYMPYKDGVTPWHDAVSATYAHATAPLRRLADRYVIRATLAIANGQPVPEVVSQAFEKLPKVMARADGRAAQINAAVINLAEAVMMQGRTGERFAATATDLTERGARIQLNDYPVVAIVPVDGIKPGDSLTVKLVSADPAQRLVTFEPVK